MHWYADAAVTSYHPSRLSEACAAGIRRNTTRARTLNDDELRTVWKAGEADGMFGAFVRIALLTAQRRAKLAAMKWADISEDGEWTIPQEPREKDSAGSLMLPPAALDIIRAQPQIGNNPFVFAGRGDGAVQRVQQVEAAVRCQSVQRQALGVARFEKDRAQPHEPRRRFV